jgi:hypothetical protein
MGEPWQLSQHLKGQELCRRTFLSLSGLATGAVMQGVCATTRHGSSAAKC